MKERTILFFILLLTACNSSSTPDPIEQALDSLQTPGQHRAYLEQLYEDDQRLRQGQDAKIMLEHGKDSPEHVAFVRKAMRQDSLNLVKVERYLARFGHPRIAVVGEASYTPWAVIHHARSYDARERNFPYLYEAYQRGDIDESAFAMYLGRMYEMMHNERLQMENPYRKEDEINKLIELLELEVPEAN